MEFIEGIKTRRSIRQFTSQDVSKETLEGIIGTTVYAPSWKNSQTARYIAVKDESLKSKIAESCVLGYQGNESIIKNCNTLVIQTVVHGRAGFERDGSYSTSKEDRWEVFDAGISAQTFCLAAHGAGLGTVIMGVFDESKVKELVPIPEGQIISSLIALGYPNQAPTAPKRKSIDDILTVL